MIDKSIPYFNVLMRYDGPGLYTEPILPKGFHFANYRKGDELKWATMEVDNNDFDTYENAVVYFKNKYLAFPEKLKERFIGVRDEDDILRGAVICWNDLKEDSEVASVHWLLTDPSIQGRGVGTVLAQMLVYRFTELNMFPIYLHSQPWSYSAICIYSKIGFRLLKTDTFRGYENQTMQAIEVLNKLIPEQKMKKLVNEMI